MNAEGKVEKYKAQQVAKGYSQVSGVITQVFLEVVEKESIPEVTTNQPFRCRIQPICIQRGLSLYDLSLFLEGFRLGIDPRVCLKIGGIHKLRARLKVFSPLGYGVKGWLYWISILRTRWYYRARQLDREQSLKFKVEGMILKG